MLKLQQIKMIELLCKHSQIVWPNTRQFSICQGILTGTVISDSKLIREENMYPCEQKKVPLIMIQARPDL